MDGPIIILIGISIMVGIYTMIGIFIDIFNWVSDKIHDIRVKRDLVKYNKRLSEIDKYLSDTSANELWNKNKVLFNK
jgi:hypothetical protein